MVTHTVRGLTILVSVGFDLLAVFDVLCSFMAAGLVFVAWLPELLTPNLMLG
jgi:hypothetical protein